MASYCPIAGPEEWCEPEPRLGWNRSKRPSSDDLRRAELIDEIILKAFAAGEVAVIDRTIAQKFHEQAEKWDRETGHISSPAQRFAHPSYVAILGMANDNRDEVVDLMLRDMRQNRREWFWALSYLTHENPIKREDAGKTDKMINAWINWGRKRGLL